MDNTMPVERDQLLKIVVLLTLLVKGTDATTTMLLIRLSPRSTSGNIALA
jgi:hypothetical protein